MCTHQRYIYNPYSRKTILVNCGKCDACRQEKANKRAERIRNQSAPGTLTFFVTLTYTNDYVPFVKREDLYDPEPQLRIYRRSSGRFVYSKKNGLRFKKSPGISCIDTISCDKSLLFDADTRKLKHLNGLPKNCIGVCYFEDVKRFFKRLRNILIRNYDYEGKFVYFVTTEYGGSSDRPHIHAAINAPSGWETAFRNAISKAWPFMFYGKSQKWFQVAKDASSYIASYVNSNINLLPALSLPDTKPTYSSSKHYGLALDCFKLSSLLSKIDRGDLHYYTQKKFDGVSTTIPVSIPEYVFSRYFPKFKGFSWLTSSQLLQLCLSPQDAGFIFRDSTVPVKYSTDGREYRSCFESVPKLVNPIYHYSSKETYQIAVRIENCYQKFHAISGLNRLDYYHYYSRVWSLLSLTSIKDSLTSVEKFEDWSDFYENTNEYGIYLLSPTLSSLTLQTDPNRRRFQVMSTNKNLRLFDKMDKRKKVSHTVLSRLGYDV